MSERSLLFTDKQLQRKFPKHAADFGITDSYSPANAQLLKQAIEAHVQNSETKIIQGTYRGKDVTHYYNSITGINVIKNAAGVFESGWKLNRKQAEYLEKQGKLGGG